MKIAERLEKLERAERDRRALEMDGLRFTSLDRVVWPGAGYTKGDLVRYYVRVAPVMLRHLAGRPLMLKRYHGDIGAEPVVQQRPGAGVPDPVVTAPVPMADGSPVPRFIGADPTLLFAAQMNAVEIHSWHSRVDTLDRPDWIVLDLDIGAGVGFRRAVRLARRIRDRLVDLGLDAAPKTSGSRGLHLYVPTGGAVDYDGAARFARRFAERVAEEDADATVERAPDARGYRVYVDHLQNAWGKTTVAPYALRARKDAPASTPLHWSEVDDDLRPDAFTLASVPARLEAVGDPWEDILGSAGDVPRALDVMG